MLASRANRHVRRVRDEHRAIEQATARPRIHELGELSEDVCQLVAALAAADVDDHVRVAPLRDRVLEHRLAGSEAAGDGCRASPRQRVQEVENAQAGDQRLGGV